MHSDGRRPRALTVFFAARLPVHSRHDAYFTTVTPIRIYILRELCTSRALAPLGPRFLVGRGGPYFLLRRAARETRLLAASMLGAAAVPRRSCTPLMCPPTCSGASFVFSYLSPTSPKIVVDVISSRRSHADHTPTTNTDSILTAVSSVAHQVIHFQTCIYPRRSYRFKRFNERSYNPCDNIQAEPRLR